MVNLQFEALTKAGYEVKLIARHTDEIRRHNPIYPLKAGLDVSTGNGYDPTGELLDFKPDVVWVHNLFPNFSTKWLAKWQGPLIATLYNYRPVCANGVLFRNGAICTLCPDGKPLSALKYGCYKDSRLASLPLTLQISKGLNANPIIARADKIVVASRRAFEFYESRFANPGRLVLIQDFAKAPKKPKQPVQKTDRWVVAARLSPEKGVKKLVEQWPDGFNLDIYGNGPERAAIEAMAKPNVRLMGQVSQEELAEALPSYVGMVFPSLWWENLPNVLLMALAANLPIVARSGSSGADLVENYGVGSVYSGTKNDLLDAVSGLANQGSSRGDLSVDAFSNVFLEEAWVRNTASLIDELPGVRIV
jgi:glycosyltransferase involved in cell wall biosynthesis